MTEKEMCDEVVNWMMDMKADVGKQGVPLYLVSRLYGKMCRARFGKSLHDALKTDGRFVLRKNERGGTDMTLREFTGVSAVEIVEGDVDLKRLVEVQEALKAAGVELTPATMEARWIEMFKTDYPFRIG